MIATVSNTCSSCLFKQLMVAAFSSDDHLISVYGWNRQTIMLTAEVSLLYPIGIALQLINQIMTMTDEIKEVVTMRTTYRETSYPAIKSALDGRLAHLEAQYATLSRKAEEIRRKNLVRYQNLSSTSLKSTSDASSGYTVASPRGTGYMYTTCVYGSPPRRTTRRRFSFTCGRSQSADHLGSMREVYVSGNVYGVSGAPSEPVGPAC